MRRAVRIWTLDDIGTRSRWFYYEQGGVWCQRSRNNQIKTTKLINSILLEFTVLIRTVCGLEHSIFY